MIHKVLIAEDIDSINEGLGKHLRDAFGFQVVQAKYCDEAYLKIKRSILDEEPFDLLITDLSFKEDHRNTNLKDGEMLVAKLREEGIAIKSIMYSIEDRPYKLKNLVNKLNLDAFVTKGRNSINEMTEVITAMMNGGKVTPLQNHLPNTEEEVMNIDEYDIALLSRLADGSSQEEIGNEFKASGIKPASLSSIEKRINKLKISLKAKNTIHLIAIAKDMGII
ncbi:response regulator transcription factor [Robertkochia marina]|uniref:Response regulator transcription factor n=1 Tax=Robertkochia marina TaxID=1227945 RepID=A0A4S3LYG2_9FLAO|nr:response regulator transcription factor [Robertkochia marina]THD66640.1 response regulator transcription factor [Robertkochia marina]TRZ45522.1 DNA-binding response regulator [Robertkochia marina]